MAILLSANTCSVVMSNPTKKTLKHGNQYKTQKTCHVVLPAQDALLRRRNSLACGAASILTIITFNYGLIPSPAWAEDKSLFDLNEKTKTGKVLPKAYLKSAREAVKNLRQSLKEDPKDIAKFIRTADAAKESNQDYLSNWRGQHTAADEESYAVLEKAIRSLASFYSKAGPSAALPEKVKLEILNDLDMAEEYL